MHNAIFHRDDMVVIRVQASIGQECIELIHVPSVEENDGWAVGRNIPSLRNGARREYAEKQDQAADLLIVRANTQGEWSPFETHSPRRELGTASMFVLSMKERSGLCICRHFLFLAAETFGSQTK
jgi:hypothetical protein